MTVPLLLGSARREQSVERPLAGADDPPARIREVAVLAALLGALDPAGRLVGEDQAVAALRDPFERRLCGDVVNPALQVYAPIVGLHPVQGRDDIVQRESELAP